MAAQTSELAIVTFELPDGTIFRGKTAWLNIEFKNEIIPLASIGDSSLIPVTRSISASMELLDAVWYVNTLEYIEDIRAKKSAIEWKCSWCSSINGKDNRECIKCSAPRSFIYEV